MMLLKMDQVVTSTIDSLLAGSRGMIPERQVEFIRALHETAGEDPALAGRILDRLYQERDRTPIQFCEEYVSGRPGPLRLIQPVGVAEVNPDTRNLTEVVIDYARGGKKSIMDIGCGCGLTSIAVADPSRTTVALDISLLAVMTARLNAIWNGVSQYMQFAHSDFADYRPHQRFDALVVNPPIDPLPNGHIAELRALYDGLRRGELNLVAAKLAANYYADSTGNQLLDLIFRRASELLRGDGVLIIDIGNNVWSNPWESMLYTARKYGFLRPEIRWFANCFADLEKYRVQASIAGEDFVKVAVRDGVEVFEDSEMKHRVKSPEDIRGGNYYFKGGVAIYHMDF